MLATPSVAATRHGQRFDDNTQRAAQGLALSGLGLRSILFIKVYVAGLYLPEKATTFRVIANMPGPKRPRFRARCSAARSLSRSDVATTIA